MPGIPSGFEMTRQGKVKHYRGRGVAAYLLLGKTGIDHKHHSVDGKGCLSNVCRNHNLGNRHWGLALADNSRTFYTYLHHKTLEIFGDKQAPMYEIWVVYTVGHPIAKHFEMEN